MNQLLFLATLSYKTFPIWNFANSFKTFEGNGKSDVTKNRNKFYDYKTGARTQFQSLLIGSKQLQIADGD